MSKKAKKKRQKRVQSHMTAKSTAKLNDEIKDLLAQEIPDPEDLAALSFIGAHLEGPTDEEIAARKRRNEELLLDQLDAQERNRHPQ